MTYAPAFQRLVTLLLATKIPMDGEDRRAMELAMPLLTAVAMGQLVFSQPQQERRDNIVPMPMEADAVSQ